MHNKLAQEISLIPPAVLVLLGSILTSEEEEEEGLFKADAVNEEDPERDRATQV